MAVERAVFIQFEVPVQLAAQRIGHEARQAQRFAFEHEFGAGFAQRHAFGAGFFAVHRRQRHGGGFAFQRAGQLRRNLVPILRDAAAHRHAHRLSARAVQPERQAE